MKVILYPLMVLAACGLALSITAHGMALAGVPIPGHLVLGLHIGIFVVWIPTVPTSMRMTRYASRKDFLKAALAGCPVWMRRAFYVLFGYGILNFVLFMATVASQPKQRQRTSDPSPSDVRGFSGHWMIFYSAAFAIYCSRIRAPHLYRERKCPQGHTASPSARFCPECGYGFSNEAKNA